MVTSASGEALCGCLRKILASLERGDAVEAAAVVPEMAAVLRALPADISQRDEADARQLLGRCVDLERSLRGPVLDSLRQMGAARKARVYRIIANRP
jgi:hypothetical protein